MCEKCGQHDWLQLSDGTFQCKNCSHTTTGVKQTSNVTNAEGNQSESPVIPVDSEKTGPDSTSGANAPDDTSGTTNADKKEDATVTEKEVIVEIEKDDDSANAVTKKDTAKKFTPSVKTEEEVTVKTTVKTEEEVSVKSSEGSLGGAGGTQLVHEAAAEAKGLLTSEEMATYGNVMTVDLYIPDNKDSEPQKVAAVSPFVKIVPEITQSRNPAQAAADARELAYLQSVLGYQMAVAQREEMYLASVRQSQLAIAQREVAYTESVKVAAAQIQQQADLREEEYLRSVKAAQAAVEEREKKYIESVNTQIEAQKSRDSTVKINDDISFWSGQPSNKSKANITIR